MVVYVDNMLAYSISMEGHGRSSVSLSLKLREHCLCAKSQSENSDFLKSPISATSFC